jgi:formamidopyrimidine-DNA glycosylase
MPELPEVEHTRRLLRRAMQGQRIVRVLARRPDLRYPLPPHFSERLQGRTVRAVRRRAKYLLLELHPEDVVLMHLGMSGSFRVARGTSAEPGAHDHVVFEMASGAHVIFNDPRRFGFMRVIAPDAATGDAALAPLGPEPLGSGFTPAALARALATRKAPLKQALSDQRVVAGLGNIYVVEALHRARLSPTRRASTLVAGDGSPRRGLTALVAAVKAVLQDALDHDHRLYGEDRFRVYDREGCRCPRRGCRGTIARIVQGGRSTFFCPVCQR